MTRGGGALYALNAGRQGNIPACSAVLLPLPAQGVTIVTCRLVVGSQILERLALESSCLLLLRLLPRD